MEWTLLSLLQINFKLDSGIGYIKFLRFLNMQSHAVPSNGLLARGSALVRVPSAWDLGEQWGPVRKRPQLGKFCKHKTSCFLPGEQAERHLHFFECAFQKNYPGGANQRQLWEGNM